MNAVTDLVAVLFWLGFLVIGIVILVALFRNRNLQLWVKALLLLLVIALPILGILVCIGVWVGTRSRNRERESEKDNEAPSAAYEAPPARRLPFPPHASSSEPPPEAPAHD
jgi:hypothetical protein